MNEKNHKDDTFLARWLEGNLTKEELSEFERSDDFAMYQKIAEGSSFLATPKWNKKEVWETIQSQSKSKTVSKKRLSIQWMLYATAACFLFIVTIVTLLHKNELRTEQTLMAESRIIELPDGSSVHINAVSKISFNEDSYSRARTLHLDGEAFFDVKKGSPFSVQTPNGTIRVLGTSFNVHSRKKDLTVQCYTGKVGVSIDDFESEDLLIKGQNIKILNGQNMGVKPSNSRVDNPSWMTGRSSFTEVKIRDVFEEMERQYDVSIEWNSRLENKLYNGGFQHDDLNKALQVVCASIPCDYKIDGGRVTLIETK